ncbi:aldehyde dehydrogenase family protein [Elusimicrobiota bacterium]
MKEYKLLIGGEMISTKKVENIYRADILYKDIGKIVEFRLHNMNKVGKNLLRVLYPFVKTRDPESRYVVDYIKKNGFPKYELNELDDLVFATYPVCSKRHRQLAVGSAKEAFREYKDVSLKKRIDILRAFAQEFRKNRERLKNISYSLGVSNIFDWSHDLLTNCMLEENALALYSKQLSPERLSSNSFIVKKPYGVFGILFPFNYVLFEGMWPILSSVLSGNTIVIKMSKYPAVLFEVLGMLQDVLERFGMPRGIINTVTGSGKEIADEWINNDDVNGIVYFGNSNHGLKLGSQAIMKSKKAVLELAGSDPVLIWKDVEIGDVVKEIIKSRFLGSGQSCFAIKKIYVHKEIFKDLVDEIVKEAKKLKIAYPFTLDSYYLDQNIIGSIKSLEQLTFTVSDAVSKGAVVHIGGNRVNCYGKHDDLGLFFEPTIVTNVNHDMAIMHEETFGPLLPIMEISGIEEAVRYINKSKYGLRASIWAQDKEIIRQYINEVSAGGVIINSCHWTFDAYTAHLGGTKLSGITGAKYFHEEMCYKKYVYGVRKLRE